MIKKVINIAIVCIIMLRVTWVLYDNRAKFVPDYWQRYPILKDVFGQSQYMMKGWKYWIPDETAYSYAAGAYAKGANPILVESTQPPLGKYLLSLSVLLFNNENVIVALFFVFLLVGVGWTAYLLSNSSIVSDISVLLLTSDSLFTNQIRYMPLLDIFEITFIVWGIACAALGLRKSVPVIFIVGLVLIGLSMMVKVWVTGAIFLCVVTVCAVIMKRSYIKYIFIAYGIIFVILLAVYAKTISSGYSPLEILKVQKWLFWYHESKINNFFTIWPLVFLNKWYVWWGSEPIIRDSNWSVLWPIITGVFLFEIVRKLVTKSVSYHNSTWDIFFYCMVIYSFFISAGQASARYLLPLFSLVHPFFCALIYRRYLLKGKKRA